MRQYNAALLNIATPEEMRAVGHALGHALIGTGEDALVIAVEGELGAGKTTLVSGVLRAAGIAGPVRSPTYTLIEPYESSGRLIYHLDLYRLADPGEVEALGVRDLLTSSAVLLIEWPSRGRGRLPAADLSVEIQYSAAPSAGRLLTLLAGSAAGDKLVQLIVAAKPELRALSS